MKVLILFSFLIGASFTHSQDLTDTIYYKNGLVRAGLIYKETNKAIKYQYINDKGRVMSSFVRKTFLNSYTVGDKRNSVASDYTSPNPVSEQTQQEREEKQQRDKKTNRAVGIGFVTVLVAIPVTLGIVLLLLLNQF